MGKANDRGHQERNRLYQKNFQRRKNDADKLLSKRVELLENAIDDMHRHFLNFTDDLISSGTLVAAPELLPGLKHITAKLLSHARDVWPNDDDDTAPNTQTSITIPRPLGVSISYCHNESSFSRYLQRAALERGYDLLADPGVSRAEVCSAFRLTPFFLELKHIREGLFELLTGPNSTTMDYLNAPFTNLGRSGTHYPRSDILTQSGSFRSQLPRFKHPEEKSLAHELQDTERLPNVAGMEGEWFDNVDIEQYLLTEKNIELNDTFMRGHMAVYHDAKAQQDWLGFPKPTSRQLLPLDVSILIAELAKSSTCIGRTPGFRRADVDIALQNAIHAAA